MIGKTNSKQGANAAMEYVNVQLTTNQSSHADMVGVKFTLTYGTYSKEYTWDGTEVTFQVPAHINYTITFGSANGYKTPDAQTFGAVEDNARTVEAVYKTELVKVNVTSNDSSSMSGAKITINGTQYTWGGTTLQHKVPFGTSYSVVAAAVSGYGTPSTQTFTANQATREVTMQYILSTLTVNIASNQSNDSTISAVKATVKYGSTSVQVTNGQKINIPTNTSISITFPAVTGYKAPSTITFTSTGGNVTKSGTYQTEIVKVTLSADNGASVSGQTVTINGTTHTWNGSAISQKVPFGTTYTVSVNAKSGYTAPSSQSFTASQLSRNVSMVYYIRLGTKEPGYGVYIQDTEGYFLTKTEWDRGHNPAPANGIAVITEQHSFVIALEISYYAYFWGTTDYNPNISDVRTEANARLDFSGKQNTVAFINANPDIYCLFKYCNEFIFPNGQNGYFASIGELCIIADNSVEITEALRSANNYPYASIWQNDVVISSSQRGESQVWWYWRGQEKIGGYRDKNDDSYTTRALTTLEL